jgi:hypothetical protein
MYRTSSDEVTEDYRNVLDEELLNSYFSSSRPIVNRVIKPRTKLRALQISGMRRGWKLKLF